MENFKINRERKSFIFDDGEEIPIPKDKVKQVLRTETGREAKKYEAEKINKTSYGGGLEAFKGSFNQSVFGNLGETAGNYLTSSISSISKGKGQEELGYIDRVLDSFYAKQEARKEHLDKLREENPIAYGFGSALGTVGELGLLHGVPAKYAIPAMGLGSSETSFLEPGEKSKEIVKEGIEGAILDKFFGGLAKVAGKRGEIRELKNIITDVEKSNAGELSKANAANEAEKLRFSTQTAARDAELKNLESAQMLENRTFQELGEKSSERVGKTIGNNPVSDKILGIEEFIAENVETSAHAATSEANYVSRFLKSVFKGDKAGKITGEGLKKGLNALNGAILKSEGATKELLTEYKSFLTQTLPEKLAFSFVMEKWIPKVVKPLEKTNSSLFKSLSDIPNANQLVSKKLGRNYVKQFDEEIRNIVDEVLSSKGGNFSYKDPQAIGRELTQIIKTSKPYKSLVSAVDTSFPEVARKGPWDNYPKFESLHKSLDAYPEAVAWGIAENLNKYVPDIALDFSKKSGNTQSALSKSPLSPNILPQPAPILAQQKAVPNLEQVPVMSDPQGIYGKLASGLESLRDINPRQALNETRRHGSTAFLAKLAGVPVAKAAAGAVAIGGGARALTSPSRAGNLLRGAIGQGPRSNVAVIEEIAQKYPSYRNGIIELPEHRRSLTKEIENLRDLSLEEKAIYQSKINRGKPLHEKL